MRGIIADEIGTAAWNCLTPVAGVLFELRFFGGIDLVANDAG